jgi:hypothetical protein
MPCAPYILAAALAALPVSVARASTLFSFVDEYIQNTAAVERIRDDTKAALAADHSAVFSECIRSSERHKLQLGGAIGVFQGLDLRGNRAKDVVSLLINFYQQEIYIYDEMGGSCQKLLVPDPKADYGKLAADGLKMNARLDYVDQSIFKATPLVFATLIDPKPDAQNHMSRLAITQDERARLVGELDSDFGKKMDKENQDWLVSSASVLRHYLTKKGYKALDEP